MHRKRIMVYPLITLNCDLAVNTVVQVIENLQRKTNAQISRNEYSEELCLLIQFL